MDGLIVSDCCNISRTKHFRIIITLSGFRCRLYRILPASCIMRLLSLLIFIPFLPLCPALACWRNTSCDGPLAPAFTGPWESYILAPDSSWIEPRSIFTLTNTTASPYPGSITLTRGQSLYVLDFGFEVGGVVHLDWSTNDTGQLGLAFSEAKNWIGESSDNSHAGDPDGAIYAPLSNGTGTYVMPDNLFRGGFRYLSLFLPGNFSYRGMDPLLSQTSPWR